MTTRTDKAARTRAEATAAFIAKKAEIDALLIRLQALSDDHFGTEAEAMNWTDVATISRYAATLKVITDAAFGEGEYAA